MKNRTKNEKNEKKQEKKKHKKREEKKGGKKGKEGPKVYLPETAQKLFFTSEKRNRNEIEAQKKSDFEHPTKKKKMKENEGK